MPDLLYPAQESLYFSNSIASVVQHTRGYARIDWCPVPISSEELRAVYEHVLQLLKETHLTRLLSDNQFRPPIMPQDQDWLSHCLIPRMVRETGYSRGAIIEAYDVQSQVASVQVAKQVVALPLTIQYFTDLTLAEQWLCQEQ